MDTGATDLWALLGIVMACLGVMMVFCRACLKRELHHILTLWDDIYFRLRERCELVTLLSDHLRTKLKTNPKLADDIRYLLKRMEETNDPHTHAAVQNGLVLTVQTAVEQFHRSGEFRADGDLSKTMEAIGVVDSQLGPLRDRFNDRVRHYNSRLNTPPFSVVAYMTRADERRIFPMLIPWWSTDPSAYGVVSSEDIRLTLTTEHAPLILAPSQRAEWSGRPQVIRVADKLLPPQTPQDDDGNAKQSDGAQNGSTSEWRP